MNITTTLKSRSFMAVLALSLGLTPIVSMAENDNRGHYKNQHPRADIPKHMKQNRKHEQISADFKPYNEHVYNKSHRDRDDNRFGRRHHDRKFHHKHRRHHHSHRYHRHNHHGRHHRHDHRYCNDRRHHLKLTDPRFMFGLHTGNVDIILGH